MAGPKRPRNAAALELAAAQGDIGAARIRIEQIHKTAQRLAEDCAQVLSQPPFARVKPEHSLQFVADHAITEARRG